MTLIHTIQQIVRAELKKIRLTELGIVTSVFPHSDDSDKDNYEVNVRLKNNDLELRKVPMATDHIGTVKIPEVGDLVMVSFINGNLNQPVITGRLYDEENRPPLSVEKEYVVQNPYGGTTLIKIDKDMNISLTAGETGLTLNADGSVVLQSADALEISVEGEAKVSVKGNVALETDGDAQVKAGGNAVLECTDAAIKASGNIDLGESGGAVVTNMTHKCFITGAPPVGSTTVKAKG
ncbi:hypothetical protein DENIS_2312 [Desulfonema ishimotonii]|uniref:Gp5/Type VI secretion system Vgr protein OB-fold domain-containing protein n=1 Tax=Desulfonema ishimotonii TaxID=45657 RepID=A0A401FWH1_9BACT|nr:phage baseplate assembly protein V [Desulfonema ishimotonii]GBC61352.1 hypothetical protein DENIS_2312 [Desulfonema ishimotonii]